MNIQVDRLRLFREVQQEFNRMYPYLKIEFLQDPEDTRSYKHFPADDPQVRAIELLEKAIGLTKDTKVIELENALFHWFGNPVRVFRKSANFWMETRMSRNWTLGQQNEHGEEISSAFL